MKLEINKIFVTAKTMEQLNTILDNQYGKKGRDRAQAEIVKGFTLNLVAHQLGTGCETCEERPPTTCDHCVERAEDAASEDYPFVAGITIQSKADNN